MSSTNADNILYRGSTDEKYSRNANQQDENIAQNQSDPAGSENTIKTCKQGPVSPTPLYVPVFTDPFSRKNIFREYPCYKTHPILTAVFIYVLFIVVAMTIGVLIVCFTWPQRTGMFLYLPISLEAMMCLYSLRTSGAV